MSKKFEEYVPPETADEGIKSGRFAAGVLRVNPKRPSDGFCVTGKDDILIKGKLDRNRAFNGDSIVVEIYPESDWHRNTTEEESEGAVDSTKVGGVLSVSVPDADRDELLLEAGASTKVSPTTSFISGRSLAQIQPPPGIIKTGRVVYVSNAIWKSRVYACSLEPNRAASSTDSPDQAGMVGPEDKLIRAIPVDKRIPWILIQVNEVLMKILNLPGKLDPTVLYPIQVMKWQTNGALPLGRIKGVAYGRVGEPEVEAKVCLAEAGLQDHEIDFPKSVHDEVEEMQANFHEEVKAESKSRIDLRHKRVFTIDPATARDLDDAIHVDIINREFIEVGVHIADVSHYVKENSELDKIAKQRCTSVYLAHRVYPMLPEGLSNGLCSLNPNEAKFTFTSWYRIRRATGEVILDSKDPNGPRFAKTIISSCCRFNYDQVQDILDGKEILAKDRPTVFGEPKNSWDKLMEDIFLLFNVCGKVRARRFEYGSVRIDKAKMRFNLDESDVPQSYEYESHSASHWMIEELMLLSNEVVAKKICDLGECAVLRRHPPPDAKSFGELSDRIRTKLKVSDWSGTTSRELFKSLQIVKERLGNEAGRLIEFLVMKTMKPAQYCSFGSGKIHHYALAFDFYTHFTSPIRRYPDIMVHRQLQTVLELDACGLLGSAAAVNQEGLNTIETQCDLCNVMKKKSREAQEKCDVSFFCIYLRHKQDFMVASATVMAVNDKCINVFIPNLGKDSPVYFKLTSRVPDWFMAGDKAKRADLDRILKGPGSITYVPDTMEAIINWRSMLDLVYGGDEIEGDEEEEEQEKFKLDQLPPIVGDVPDSVRVGLFSQLLVVIVPLETVPISFATVLLPPEFEFKYGPVKMDEAHTAIYTDVPT